MKKLYWGLLSLALLCVSSAQAGDEPADKVTRFGGFGAGKGGCAKSKVLFGDKKKTGDKKAVDDKKTDDKKPDGRQGRRGRGQGQGGLQFPFQGGRGGAALISEKEIEELKLTKDQKEKVEKIVKDYETSSKEFFEKLRSGGVDREKIREAMEERQKVRKEAEEKVVAVLKDDQKKKFEDLKKARPARGGFGGPGGPGGGFGRAPFHLGQVIPGNTKDRLDLTDEQKKKIEELEKEVKAKLEKILTVEQTKKLQEGGGGRPGGGRPGTERPGGGGGRPRPDLD